MTTCFLLEFRRNRGIVLWTTIAVVAYGATMAFFWPIMRDNAAQLEGYLKIFPSGFLAAFGMEGSLADPGVFFTTYIGSWLWPIIAALVAILMATRPVAVDLERGFIDLPLATPISRRRYLAATIAAHAVGLGILAAAAVLGFWAAATVAGAPYDLVRMLALVLLAWAVGCAIAACTSVLAVITLSRMVAAGVAAAVLLAMYLLNVVAQIQPDLAGLSTFSLFHYFRPTPVIDTGALPVVEFLLLALIAGGAWILAVRTFERRDLAA